MMGGLGPRALHFLPQRRFLVQDDQRIAGQEI